MCQLFFNVVFVLHYFNEKIQRVTGFSHTLVLNPNNILNSPITNNRQKLQVQFAFPGQQLFSNPDLAGATTGF
jgi:hypothetical protein